MLEAMVMKEARSYEGGRKLWLWEGPGHGDRALKSMVIGGLVGGGGQGNRD